MKPKSVLGFVVGRKIGDGTFSDVYHGRHRDGRVAAIKVYSPHERIKWFDREVFILDKAAGPGVVGKTGSDRETRSIVLDFVPGKDLYDYGPFYPLEKWFPKLCLIVKSLHDKGMSHNDIHSGNVILNARTMTPTLIDFSHAKLRSSPEEKELDIDCLGTLASYYRDDGAVWTKVIERCTFDPKYTIDGVINDLRSL